MKSTFKLITALALLITVVTAGENNTTVVATPPQVSHTITAQGAKDGDIIIVPSDFDGYTPPPMVIIKTVHFVCPSSTSPNYNSCLANAEGWMESGVKTTGNLTNNPAVPGWPSLLEWWHITESPAVPSWLGQLNPPALANEHGHITPFAVIVNSPTDIRLADLRITLSSNDPYAGHPQGSLALVLRMDGIPYSSRAVGIKADGTRVTSGLATQPVRMIFFTGVASGFVGNTAAEFLNIQAWMAAHSPFTIMVKWDLLDTVSGNSVASAVDRWSAATSGMPRQGVRLAVGNLCCGSLQVLVYGSTNYSYDVQSASNILGPWTEWGTVYSGGNGVSTLTIPGIQSRAKLFLR